VRRGGTRAGTLRERREAAARSALLGPSLRMDGFSTVVELPDRVALASPHLLDSYARYDLTNLAFFNVLG
jgi:hypothetical protein